MESEKLLVVKKADKAPAAPIEVKKEDVEVREVVVDVKLPQTSPEKVTVKVQDEL